MLLDLLDFSFGLLHFLHENLKFLLAEAFVAGQFIVQQIELLL
jgi:hypothetical protein